LVYFFHNLGAHAVATGGLTFYSESLNKLIFGKKLITTEKEKT
jgi:hypothetical protein